MATPQRAPDTAWYPESDGEPTAETDTHRLLMTDLIFTLEEWFRDDPQVYVSGNLLMYYVEGDPRKSVPPDVFVVRGVPKGKRRIYKVWEEGKAPDVVIEITSSSTRLEDVGPKKGLYAMLGVREYFLFDPLADYLRPRLRGFQLEGEEYRPMKDDPLVSEVLGLELRVEDDGLRLYRPDTGARLVTPEEEASARRALEEEIARLKGELGDRR